MNEDLFKKTYGTSISDVHPLYEKNQKQWKLYEMAYEGGEEFIKFALHKHRRESYQNWMERIQEGINFNYSEAVIDLFNFYLFDKPATRHFNTDEFKNAKTRREEKAKRQIKNHIIKFADDFGINDTQWKMFTKDCDLNGRNFDDFMIDSQKTASIYGSCGILITKGQGNYSTRAEEISAKVYPYCMIFTLPQILDWKFKRNKDTGRNELVYLKLQESDSTYLVWTLNTWERWELDDKSMPLIKDHGINPLNEVPFTWMPNIRSVKNWFLGQSDIKEISRITASIIRNISCGEEMLKFCGFPMMIVPMEEEGIDDGSSGDNEQESGPTAVHEFNPEYGENGKPSWMEPAIGEAVDANLKWTDRKADEIYRIAHLSGVHGQRKSNNEVASGLALRYEFQQLNSVLIKKTRNMCEAEITIIQFWLKWQSHNSNSNPAYNALISGVEVVRPKSFSVDDLSMELQNLFDSISEIPSNTFRKLGYKKAATSILPDMRDDEVKTIVDEINSEIDNGNVDFSKKEKGMFGVHPTNRPKNKNTSDDVSVKETKETKTQISLDDIRNAISDPGAVQTLFNKNGISIEVIQR